MAEPETRARKKLNAFDATMLVMGGIIGVGIFFAPQNVAKAVPDTALFAGLWVAGAIVAMCGAMTFAEWGGSFPKAGGWFVFLREAFGPFAAFLFAWVVLGVVTTGALAVIASFGASQLVQAFSLSWPDDSLPHFLIAASFVIVLTAIVLCGIKIGATVQNLCMITKLAGIGALVLGGLAFFAPGAEAVAAEPVTAPPLTKGLPLALLSVFFAFGGWQHLCYVAPQVNNATRTLPRAIVIGVLGVGLVYVLANVTYVRVLGIDRLATTKDFAWQVAQRSLGDGFGRALSAVMAVSAFGVCAVNIIVSPAIYVAMAREGLFFKSFGNLHARTGAPVLALWTQLAITLAYLVWSHLSVRPADAPLDEFRLDVNALIDSVVFAEWFFHFLVAAGLLQMRRNRPDLPRPFRSPLWPLAPAVYLATAAFILGGNLVTTFGVRTLLGLGVLAVGAAVYRPWRAAFADS